MERFEERERDLKIPDLDSRTETSLRERERNPSSSSSSEEKRYAGRAGTKKKNGGVRRGRGE